MFKYKNQQYNQLQYKKICQQNGIYNSYLEYINNNRDFSVPCLVYIRQSDIEVNPVYNYITKKSDFSGTLQLCNPSYYIIAEDLTFNYNPEYLYTPTPEQTLLQIPETLIKRNYNQKYLYPTFKLNGAFDLGFFAGIIIDGNNICLTSNHKKIQMHPTMHLIQRFFALICLGSQPFIPNTGPINSTIPSYFPKNTIISNINFGLTSHHSILGNETCNLKIQQCFFTEFETAAISLNNADCTIIQHNTIKNNLQTVPVNSNFFSFVMQCRMLTYLYSKYPDLQQIATSFLFKLQSIINKFKLSNKVTDDEFSNTTNGLTDAISMGIFISQKGPSVNGTGICEESPLKNPSDRTNKITITHNTISNIVASPQQTTAVVKDGKPVVLSNGKLFYISKKAKTQTQFLEFVSKLSPSQWLSYKPYFTPTSLTPELAKELLTNPTILTPYCNADIMNHLLKPNFGMRIQYTSNLKLSNNLVSNIKNCNNKITCPPKGFKHPSSECLTGNDCVGILLSKTTSKLNNNFIKNIFCNSGKALTFVNG